jgi:hypothetical protein
MKQLKVNRLFIYGHMVFHSTPIIIFSWWLSQCLRKFGVNTWLVWSPEDISPLNWPLLRTVFCVMAPQSSEIDYHVSQVLTASIIRREDKDGRLFQDDGNLLQVLTVSQSRINNVHLHCRENFRCYFLFPWNLSIISILVLKRSHMDR